MWFTIFALLQTAPETPEAAVGALAWTIIGALAAVVVTLAGVIAKLFAKNGSLHAEIKRMQEDRIRYLEAQLSLLQTLRREIGPKGSDA